MGELSWISYFCIKLLYTRLVFCNENFLNKMGWVYNLIYWLYFLDGEEKTFHICKNTSLEKISWGLLVCKAFEHARLCGWRAPQVYTDGGTGVVCVNGLQIMGLWENLKLQFSCQSVVLFRMSWVAMSLGTLQCTLGSSSYTSIEIVTAGHYNQSSDISGVFFL